MKVYRASDGKPMDVGLLREILAEYPDDAPIVMSSDAEGNTFKPLLEVGQDNARVSVNHGWGEVFVGGSGPAVFLTPYD